MKGIIPDNKVVNVMLFTFLGFSLLFSSLPTISFAQTPDQKILNSQGSVSRPPSPPPTGQVYIDRSQIYTTQRQPLYLAGGVWVGHWSVGQSTPNGLGKKVLMQRVSDAGANLIVFPINLELWQHQEYRQNFDTFIQWAKEYHLYYILKLQRADGSAGDGGIFFSGPGSNYKIAEDSTRKQMAINMFKDWATLYGDDPNFIGMTLLNEPYSGYEYSHWKSVKDYYVEAIDAVTPIDSDCIFYVMEPWDYGMHNFHWNDPSNPYRGYLPRENVVYEYHDYYHQGIGWHPWNNEYVAWDNNGGYDALTQYHTQDVMSPAADGHPVYCGEFGIYSTDESNSLWPSSPDPDTNYVAAHIGQTNNMIENGIHYAQFYFHPIKSSNVYWGMTSPDGTQLNEAGQLWASLLPSELEKP
jgi:hypothetical protein